MTPIRRPNTETAAIALSGRDRSGMLKERVA
jgi:hypothetical protein